MFGYVRPRREELKVKEYELFRAAYCGLCAALRQRYGLVGRWFVSYDLAFLAMLSCGKDVEPRLCAARCPASPCRKRKFLRSGPAFDRAADLSVILYWWKLRDAAQDGGFKEKLLFRPLCFLLRGKLRRAAEREPDFARLCEEELKALSAAEKAGEPSLDRAADHFASILRGMAARESEAERRVLEQLLYELGRFIYILDAVEDYPEDSAAGRYNPLCARYETGGAPLTEEQRGELRVLLRHCEGLIGTAWELKEKNVYEPVLGNIVYLGLENAEDLVFAGKWHPAKREELPKY